MVDILKYCGVCRDLGLCRNLSRDFGLGRNIGRTLCLRRNLGRDFGLGRDLGLGSAIALALAIMALTLNIPGSPRRLKACPSTDARGEW